MLLTLKVQKDKISSHTGRLKLVCSVLNGFNHCQLNIVMLKQCPYTAKTQMDRLMGDKNLENSG